MANQSLNSIILILFLLVVFCSSSTVIASEHGTIRVGGSAESIYEIKTSDVEIVFTLLFNEMFKDLDEQFAIKIYDTDADLALNVSKRNLDVVFTNTTHFLEIEDHLRSNAFFAVRHGTSIKPKIFLLVRKDSGIAQLKQLRNKKIAIPTGHNVGELFLDVELLRLGLPISENYFSEIRRSKESNAAIVNLFFGQVDAALVTEFSFDVAGELNQQIFRDLVVLTSSDPLVHMVISVHKDFPLHRVDNIFKRLEGIEKTPRLMYLTKTFHFQGVHQIQNDDICEVRQLKDEFRRLLNGHEMP
ncbi:MAG: PhnD/SsuA/transferrin family substrate-binding protein [Candidatus Thiodiazotropha sp. (ex Troendleina suluensis)]|nr:PhnD/SsuA/transferrin family substrate-binding protein [Candidatus Thiodiazotropha sp. (ex Troendleina suluensis)]